jgi:hypothetical protein
MNVQTGGHFVLQGKPTVLTAQGAQKKAMESGGQRPQGMNTLGKRVG